MENQNKGLDKNQIIGFVLIATIMGVFGWWQSKYAPEEAVVPAVEESQVMPTESELIVLDAATENATAVVDSSAFVAEEFVIENNEFFRYKRAAINYGCSIFC